MGQRVLFYTEKKKGVQFAQKLEVMNFHVSKVLCPESNKTKLVKKYRKNNHNGGTLKSSSSKSQYKQNQQGTFERHAEGAIRALHTREEEWTLFSVPRGHEKWDTDQYQAMRKSQQIKKVENVQVIFSSPVQYKN